MRKVIGTVLILLIVTGTVLTILALWGIQPISWSVVWRSGASVIIFGVALALVSLINVLFLPPSNKNK